MNCDRFYNWESVDISENGFLYFSYNSSTLLLRTLQPVSLKASLNQRQTQCGWGKLAGVVRLLGSGTRMKIPESFVLYYREMLKKKKSWYSETTRQSNLLCQTDKITKNQIWSGGGGVKGLFNTHSHTRILMATSIMNFKLCLFDYFCLFL